MAKGLLRFLTIGTVACATLLVGGCGMSNGVIATMGMPTSETAPAGTDAPAAGPPPGDLDGASAAVHVDAEAAGVSRRAHEGGRAAVERTAGAEHRLLRVPGPRGQSERPGGVGLRAADGARRRP